MKVGIMSMQRVKNLGSFMQAYGLKSMIESLGHSVIFIDCAEGEKVLCSHNFKVKKNIVFDKFNKFLHVYNVIKFKKLYNYYYDNIFQCELKKYLNIRDDLCRDKCDCLVVGSDEVFNCLNNQFGFSDDIFGGYKNANNIISYAASCGWTKIELLNSAQKDILSASIPNFKSVSVRDENTRKFISCFYNNEIYNHLDPVLVSDFSKFNKKCKYKVKSKYIIIYAYYNRFADRKDINNIKKFAKIKKCKIIAVGSPQYWCDDYAIISPFEIFDFFSNAEYVFTDTFHGTIFSIRSHSKFLTFIRDSNNNKLSDLLNRLSLGDRLCEFSDDIFDVMERSINYNKVDIILEKERKRTLDYLYDNLS